MSKHGTTKFEPSPRDFYRTPRSAVDLLIPHLRGVKRFAEPCCGEGDLVRHLEAHELECTYAGDIKDGADALTRSDYGDCDVIVTNPPFSRANTPLLHALIRHFMAIAPTWLLLPWDFSANKGAPPFMARCSDKVSISKVQWFAGSPSTSKDNFGWYRFDSRHRGPTIEWGYGVAPMATCRQCGGYYEAQRSISKYCKAICRKRAWRARVPSILQ